LEAAGPLGQLTPYVPVGYGFAAIIVAYVGRLPPGGQSCCRHPDEHVLHRRRTGAVAHGVAEVDHRRLPGLLLFTLLACGHADPLPLRWPRRAAVAKGA